jgi:hypothetical protein
MLNVFSAGRSCPVKVNTIEEPIFEQERLKLLPVKFYAVEEPILIKQQVR